MNKIRKLLKYRTSKIVLEILFFILLYLAVRAYMQRDLVTGPVPTLQATTLTGNSFDITQPREGPLLVHFWASWCPVCRLEQESIQSISQDYPMISIALNSGDALEVEQFMQEHKLSFPVINDPDGTIAKRFGVSGVPASFVLNSRNQIRYVERGYTTEWGLRLRLWLTD